MNLHLFSTHLVIATRRQNEEQVEALLAQAGLDLVEACLTCSGGAIWGSVEDCLFSFGAARDFRSLVWLAARVSRVNVESVARVLARLMNAGKLPAVRALADAGIRTDRLTAEGLRLLRAAGLRVDGEGRLVVLTMPSSSAAILS